LLLPVGRAEQARQRAAMTDIANLEIAVDAFEIDCGRYPSTAEGLDALLTNPAGLKGWNGPYIKSAFKDPWGRPYVYRCPGRHNTKGFDLYSLGPDGKEGGGDDITNWSEQPKTSAPSSPAPSPAPGPAVREASPQATQPGSD
jgi:general secretion pathway protein G